VGCALAEAIASSGHEVWGLRREPELLPEGIRPLTGDLTRPATLEGLPGQIDYVFYTAGAGTFSDEAYAAAYVQGVENILAALESQGQRPKRILFTSSTGVYGQMDGGWVDEKSPADAPAFSGKRALEGERLFQESPFESVSVRLGGIYGPGRTALIDRVRNGAATLEAEPRYLNLIHLEDIVGALVHLMQLERVESVYVGVDSEPQLWNEFLCWIAGELNLPEPVGFGDAVSKRGARNRRCSNARLRASGYAFRYPSSREGYRELIRASQ